MKANEVRLTDFLSKTDTQFVIPIYQRNYDWKKNHCEQLINDILEAGRNEKIHFIGSIVYVHDGVYSSGIKELVVIDGQQRITTITLLCIALYHFLREKNPTDMQANKILKQFIVNEFAEENQRLKLKVSENNDSDLKALINDYHTDEETYSNIITNYKYFKHQISDENVDTILRGINMLIFVEVSLDRIQDNAQRIFESMNSTGLDLSQADLIRNYILMNLSAKEQNEIYKKYCLGEFENEKENDMKSCNNCANKDCFAGSLECRGCELNISMYHKGYLNRWVPDVNHKSTCIKEKTSKPIPAIKDVIFNPPATIIIWEDKTKTVVKCGENDIYDPEKGMAMAISRKALGDRGSYYNVFEKWLEPYIEKCEEFRVANPLQSAIYESLSNMSAKTNKLREIINNMSEQVLSHTDVKIVNTETGEVTSSDISEYEAKKSIKKMCSNCKRRDLGHNEPPCLYCKTRCDIYNRSYWEPEESDD